MAGKIIADTIESAGSQISLNVGNVTILTASSTGLTLTPTSNVNINVTNSTLAFGAGNVSFPSITTSGDTNTGLYFPAADQVGIVTGGVAALSFSSTQVPTFAKAASGGTTVQVFTSGSGTYTKPANCKAIWVRLVGGGSSGATYLADNATGGNTTFDTLSANAASGGTGGRAGAGGTASGGDINISGSAGGSGTASGTTAAAGNGGSSFFGGGGIGGTVGQAGSNAATNSGSGGGGGAVSSSVGRAGGSAGGYCEKLINSPAATYSYAVGAGGTAPTNAGAGGAGIIIVTEFYI